MCITCGGPRPPRRKYCSDKCMYARPSKPYESWALRRERYERKAETRQCVCGESFRYVKKLREKFCSKECAATYAERPSSLPKACEWRCEVPWRECVYCGSPFVSRYRTAKYCSQRCEPNWRPVPPSKLVCVICDGPFLGPRGTRYCSRRCYQQSDVYKDMRHRHNHTRRTRLAGGAEKVYRSRIFKRDGWVCQLCHRKVDKALKWPHPMSPSIDHIIPAAAGGTHEPRNVQLAHLICNSKRREVGPAQLILFGEAA